MLFYNANKSHLNKRPSRDADSADFVYNKKYHWMINNNPENIKYAF